MHWIELTLKLVGKQDFFVKSFNLLSPFEDLHTFWKTTSATALEWLTETDLGSISPTCLQTAFTFKDPKSAKRLPSHRCLFALFGSLNVKSVCKTLVKLTPKNLQKQTSNNVFVVDAVVVAIVAVAFDVVNVIKPRLHLHFKFQNELCFIRWQGNSLTQHFKKLIKIIWIENANECIVTVWLQWL